MAEAILFSTDLMFISKVKEVAAASQGQVRVVRSVQSLEAALKEFQHGGTLIIDLEKTGVPHEQIAGLASSAQSSGWRVVSFFSHVHEDVAQQAENLALGEVMPRSKFVRLLPSLFW